jgi:hypothetical protein
MEENFIEQNLAKNTSIQNPDNTFLPKNGTPGPASAELDNGKIRVLFIDTYWLILAGFKKTMPADSAVEKTFYHTLDSLMADATRKKQKILIVAHHPVYSVGFSKYYLIPKRIAQSFTSFPAYRRMADRINAILKKYPGTYYASGHIHAMEYFHTDDNLHYIISGAGSKTYHVSKKQAAKTKPCSEKECILWNDKGFFELDFYKDSEKVIVYYNEGKKKCDLSEGCK